MTWSAPSDFARAHFSSVPAVAITVAPKSFAICTAALPTPDPAACTSTQERGSIPVLLTSMFHHSQPQEIVEVIQEQPLQPEPSSFDDGHGDDSLGGDRYADNGFADTSYDDSNSFGDDSSFFGDDDGDLFS